LKPRFIDCVKREKQVGNQCNIKEYGFIFFDNMAYHVFQLFWKCWLFLVKDCLLDTLC